MAMYADDRLVEACQWSIVVLLLLINLKTGTERQRRMRWIGGCHRLTGIGPRHVLLAPVTSCPTIIDESATIRGGLSIFPVPELQL